MKITNLCAGVYMPGGVSSYVKDLSKLQKDEGYKFLLFESEKSIVQNGADPATFVRAKVIRFLSNALISCPKDFKEALESASEQLIIRARTVKLRSLISEETSGLLQRTKSFWTSLRIGGYFPDKSNLCLGSRSTLKDL